MCGGGRPPQDTEAQDRYADMIRWLDEDWETRFKPLESSLVQELQNKDENIRQSAEQAKQTAEKSYQASLGMADRNMAKYGTQLSEDQLAAQQRQQSIAGQGAVVGAGNMARDATTARYEQLQNGMLNLGRGIQSGAVSGMGNAAQMEANRNRQNMDIYYQNRGNRWSSLGSAIGMAAMYAMGSSKTFKENIRPASTEKALADIESIDLKYYDYKPGLSFGREEKNHIGGMAEDMPDSMTAAGGKLVDLGDTAMNLVGATQELAKRIERLEKNG